MSPTPWTRLPGGMRGRRSSSFEGAAAMSASSPSPVPLEVAGPRSVRAGGDVQTASYRTGDARWLRLTRSWGEPFPIELRGARPPRSRTPICGTRPGRAGAWELSTAAAPERRPLRHAWTAACVRRNTPSSATIDVTSACTTLTEVEVGHTVRSCRQVTACTPGTAIAWPSVPPQALGTSSNSPGHPSGGRRRRCRLTRRQSSDCTRQPPAADERQPVERHRCWSAGLHPP